ncbi:PHD finger protein ALFIN-LIKE 1 [Cardamine amara subsp. amara]|uniref:PHD finger protein ALFIN-LIKE n=1 Tax=Cardamine amara subsp. amara TaxID=228776 RepID=A0ABD0ZSV1_CARAN
MEEDIIHRIFASSPEDDDFLPKTVEDIFNDFTGRRSGFIRAFTTDAARFYSLCDPEIMNLCVYAHPNGTWEVNSPVEVLPPNLPQPVLGINFAIDGMQFHDWLSFVAVHSDCWLLSISSFFSANARLTRHDRNRLFDLINNLTTLSEVVTIHHAIQTLFQVMTRSAYYRR